ncbi:MAG: hypothetical protein HY978_00255 [Candidatus Liptonbacteria bacterium]|nr:hypothetical protein [Candidatus Liptonbacteria bacterium]
MARELEQRSVEQEKRDLTIDDIVSIYQRTRAQAKLLKEHGRLPENFGSQFHKHWTMLGRLYAQETGKNLGEPLPADEIIPPRVTEALTMIRNWATRIHPRFRATLSPLEKHSMPRLKTERRAKRSSRPGGAARS